MLSVSEWIVSAEAEFVFGCCLSAPKRTKRFPLNYWTTQVLHLLSAFKVAKTVSYFSFKILQGQGTSIFYHSIMSSSFCPWTVTAKLLLYSHNKDKVGHFPGSESFVVPGATVILTNHCLQIRRSWFAVWWSSEIKMILDQYKCIFHFCESKEKQYYNIFTFLFFILFVYSIYTVYCQY